MRDGGEGSANAELPGGERSMRALARRYHPAVFVALALAFVYHGSLLLTGTYKGTYDVYVHIFFADHYARAWFDHWEPRWYTGFPMVSYPPGSHYSMALLSFAVGLPTAFVIVALCAILNCTLGIYRFSRIWVSEEASGYASLLFVFASSIAETVHVFGQLPTMFSLGFLLNTLPFVYRWITRGKLRFLLTAWVMNAATTAGHHVTTLFGAVFFVAPVIVAGIVEAFRTPLPDEPSGHVWSLARGTFKALVFRRLRRVLPAVVRAAIYGPGLIVALVFVVLPYWLWSKADPITQVSIPHASRDSFLENTSAGFVFWLIPYGLSLLTLPYAFYKGFASRAWPMAASYALLVLLGTGGTTPIPRALLRGAFDVLTLDRFTFWATITQLPLLGEFVSSLLSGRLGRYTREQFGELTWRMVQVFLLVSYLAISGLVANLTKFRKFQPATIDFQPIVTFLEKDEHWRWRFLTLGFGDQMAWLSAQTQACSVDGNYHSARRLPELTSTPVERLEGAKYSGIPGIGSLQQFLAVPEKYNLKFVLSNDQFYDPLLFFSGWHRLQRLENGIMVWEREDIPPMPAVLPRKEIPTYQRVMWGIVPIGMLFTAVIVFSAPIWGPYVLWVFNLSEGGLTTGLSIRRRFWGWLVALARLARRAVQRIPVRRAVAPLLNRAAALDRRLLELSRFEPDSSVQAVAVWQVWRVWFARLPRLKPAPPSAHHVRLTLLSLAAVITAAVVTLKYLARTRTPTAVIEAYYDDVDFRRFSEAYERLDPVERPDLAEYMLRLSVKGGIVASYGKLDAVRVKVEKEDAFEALARVHTSWVTSIARYEVDDTLTLRRRDGRWFIAPEAVDLRTPQDQFFRRGEVGWVSQGRRKVTTGTTAVNDVLDRPEIQVLSQRLVLGARGYAVVGELVNVDGDPADLTITAYLRDKKGKEISRYNAQQGTIHKVFPKEVTPFRVDFEGVAGASLDAPLDIGLFDPDKFTAPKLTSEITAFEVYGKAVVTRHDLQRDLVVLVPEVTLAGTQWWLSGQLFNSGTLEATIPHVLLTYYDLEGRVAWVDHHYVRDAVRPQRALDFRVPLSTVGEQVTVLDRREDAAAPQQKVRSDGAWPERLPLPEGMGFSAMRISVHAFVAEGH